MFKRALGLVLSIAFVAAFAAPAMAGNGWGHGGWGHGGWGHGCCWGGSHNSFSLSLAFGFPVSPGPFFAPAPVFFAPPVVYAAPPVVYSAPVVVAAPAPVVAATPTVSAVPTRDFHDTSGRYCREYQRTALINGRQQQIFGTACQMPDGAWRIVSE